MFDLKEQVFNFEYSYQHVDQACEAARKAYKKWAHTSYEDRKNLVLKLKEQFQQNAERIAEIIARETGKPFWEFMTEAKALVVQEMQEQKAEAVEDTVSDIPSWCIELPKSNVAIYSCGIGNSSQLNLARSRALLDAKRQIADQIDSEISSLMDDFMDTIGTDASEQVRQREAERLTRRAKPFRGVRALPALRRSLSQPAVQ